MTSVPRPFRVEVPEADLRDLHERLTRTRWTDELPDAGWDYGVNRDWLRELVEYWRTSYDWRAHEAALNLHPQFTVKIDGQNVHFVHVRSPEQAALPLLISHGWPSTVADLLELIGPLTDPRAHGGDPADAFDVVLPSLPGFGFSGPTRERGWGLRRIARAWAELMRILGYDRYALQGGDVGSLVAPEVARVDTDRVLGVHLNSMPLALSAMTPAELDGLGLADRALSHANGQRSYARAGYRHQMATRPQTLAYALNDSPVGQLAWNLELYVDYDPTETDQAPVDRDAILTNATIFWLTGTAGSAARLYLEAERELAEGRPKPSGVPTAMAAFAGSRAIPDLARLSNTIVRWRTYDTGGHFAALQVPQALTADIREFYRGLREAR